VQTDQLRSASWERRGSRFVCEAPAGVLDEVRAVAPAVGDRAGDECDRAEPRDSFAQI
jgi:hypothetical protein